MVDRKTKIRRIRELNDRLRKTFAGGRVVQTRGIAALPFTVQHRIQRSVKNFDAFTGDNDPYKEHDFGRVEVGDHIVLFKLDYYEKGSDFSAGAEHPDDAETTDRVLTIMLADEY